MITHQPHSDQSADSVVRVAAGAFLTGTLTIDGDLVVEGRVDGQIHVSGALTIARGAAVHAGIEASAVTILGKVSGIIATQRLHLARSAYLDGEARATKLIVDDGATIKGTIAVSSSAPDSVSSSAPDSPRT